MLIMTYYDDDDDDDDDGDDDDADDDDDDDDDDEEEEDDDDYDDDDEVPSCCSFDVTTCESSLRMRDGLGLHRKPSLFFVDVPGTYVRGSSRSASSPSSESPHRQWCQVYHVCQLGQIRSFIRTVGTYGA